ncbi:MAG: hypothetical protein ACP5QD_05370, partial [Candidatus Ratteibacteria bacterium]
MISNATIEICKSIGTPAMIGCTSNCTKSVIGKARYVTERETDVIQVALSFWLDVPDQCIIGFFKDIANEIGHIPI